MQQIARVASQFNDERHPANRVRGAREARIEAANGRLDAVQHAFADLSRRDEAPSRLLHGHVHREIILRGCDQQIGFLHEAVGIHLVVMEQRAARRFARSDSFKPVQQRLRTDVFAENLGIFHQLLDALDGAVHTGPRRGGFDIDGGRA